MFFVGEIDVEASLGIILGDMVGILDGLLVEFGHIFVCAETIIFFMTGPQIRDLAAILPSFESELCLSLLRCHAT